MEPPTYAFYSLSYALLLVVAIKDYWMHSGDASIVSSVWDKLKNLMEFTEKFVDERGLVVAPPPLSSKSTDLVFYTRLT
jgi:alpha-L-rhamnosidase